MSRSMISLVIMMIYDDGHDDDDVDNDEDAVHEVDIDEDKSLSNLDEGRSSPQYKTLQYKNTPQILKYRTT